MPTGIDYFDDIEEKKKKNDERYKRKRDKELTDLAAVLRTVEGRRFAYRLLSEAGLYSTTLSGNDPCRMAWLEGKKDTGYLLMKDIHEIDLKIFVQMQTEHFAKLRQEEAEEKKAQEEKEKQ